MATTKQAPKLIGHTHYVTIDEYGRGEGKEEIFLYLNAEWRGDAAMVSMSATRYQYRGINSDTPEWSDWRIYASEARGGFYYLNDAGNTLNERGANLTDTARRRLSDQGTPIVTEWLASDQYHPSRQGAMYHAFYRAATDLSRYSSEPTKALRTRLAAALAADDIRADDAAHITKIADAYDAFVRATNERD